MPATSNYIQSKGYDAAAAITKFRAVKYSAVDALENVSVTPVTADTDAILGVAQESVSAGEIAKGKGAEVMVEGDTEWECSAAVAVGVEVMLASDGRCLPATTGKRVHGICTGSPTANAGERCRVHLGINGRILP